jgi:hypothetical protein
MLMICIGFTNYIYAQEICVFDAELKEPIPYVTVTFPEFNKWQYSSSNGCFTLPSNMQFTDSVRIAQVGYKEVNTTIANLTEKIYLVPISIMLEEVMVLPQKMTTIQLGYVKEKTISISRSIFSEFQFYIEAVYIPNNRETRCVINKLLFPYKFKKEDAFDFVVRPQLYTVGNDGMPDKPLLNSTVTHTLTGLDRRKKIYEINCIDDNIVFPENGIFIALEIVDILDKEGNRVRATEENDFQNTRTPFLMITSEKTQIQSYVLTDQNLKWHKSNLLLNYAFSMELKCYE